VLPWQGIVSCLIASGNTYLWAGCAFEDYMEIRRVARKDWQLARENHSVVAYWRSQ
jgi:NADPH-dependent ferric siderophore reductase